MTEFSYATHTDSAGLLDIMESDITPGGLQLLYTRRDDPYASYLAESPEAKVGIVRSDGKITATLAAIPRRMYVGGTDARVCYVTNMKRLNGCTAYVNWHKMFKEMCEAVNCEYYFCSLLAGNRDVQSMLHKKRKHMPYAIPLCGYKTYIISPKTKITISTAKYEHVKGRPEDEPAIVSFLNSNGRQRDLFPVFDKLSDIGDIKAENFCLLKRDGRIAAAGALWDRGKVKQYIVKGCHGIYALLRMMNPLLPYLGYIQIPKDDEPAPVAFVSFVLAENDDEELYRHLLGYICAEARDRYSMLVIGTDDSNPKRHILDGLRAVSFETQINEVIMSGLSGKEHNGHSWNNMEIECALL